MNVFDIIIAALLIFAFVRGFAKGFFVEVASLIALIGGVWGAIHFSYFAADLLEERVDWDENYIALTAFAITFIAIVITVSSLGKVLTKVADFAALGLVNKILGGVFALLKSVLILSVIFVFFSRVNGTIPFVGKETLDNSILYAPVKSIVPTIFPSIIEEIETKETEINNGVSFYEKQ
ncbi:CvpA family protein [Pseudotenacibaculum sp. MALMAid0570]|uniref:CvpA family protein n=1 Tax=Pseudotenacibaculum sp. MALMAid0570 TaxID=3143938 RepID=UPI0032DF7D7A